MFFLAKQPQKMYNNLAMERKPHFYVSPKNVLTWLMVLCMVCSAVARIMDVGGKGPDLWSQIVLPVAACLLYALITSENSPSLRFHEKCGYHVAAVLPGCGRKFGRWLDLYWMEKSLKIGENPSAFPCSWLSIVQDAKTFHDILDSLSLF